MEPTVPNDSTSSTVESVPPPEPDNPKRARGIIVLGEEDPTQLDEQAFKEQAPLFHASKNPDFHVDETFDYGTAQQAEGMTLGRGLYATSSRTRATEYMVHGVSESNDRVFPLMPYQARMLDLRQVGDPSQNATVPKEIVAQWVAFAQPHIEARLQQWQGDASKAISRRALSRLMVRFQHLAQREDVDLRADILGTWDTDAQVATPGSQVADIWDAFCKTQGIDGIIYNEGGEMNFADTPDTTYVFNNLTRVGTYGDWQRRLRTESSVDELAAVRSKLKELGGEYDFIGGAKVYSSLRDGQQVEYATFGTDAIEIDEENLDIDKVNPESLEKGWERDREWFTDWCEKAGTDFDPHNLYKAYLIQGKVLRVLGAANAEAAGYGGQRKLGSNFKLSEAKGQALCSEQALLAAYLAEKIGEPYKLIVGTTMVDEGTSTPWRESHMYVWFDSMNAVLDITAARDAREFPALMVPVEPGVTFETMAEGFDIECQRIGTDSRHIYGLEAGGFGTRLFHHEAQDNTTKAELYANPDYVSLYRYENPLIPYDESREGITSRESLIGAWYTDSLDQLKKYTEQRVKGVKGGRFVVVRIAKADMDKYDATKLPETNGMDIEPGNYVIPPDIGAGSRVEVEGIFDDAWEGKKNVPFKDWSKIGEYIHQNLTDQAIIERLKQQ